MVNRTTFAMIRLGVSNTPIGLTPGHLSRAIRKIIGGGFEGGAEFSPTMSVDS